MPVSIKCPGCAKILRAANAPTPGKKIKCPACGEVFVPEMEGGAARTAIQKKTTVKAPPPVEPERPQRRKSAPTNAARRDRDDDEDLEEERPRRRKKSIKKSGPNLPLILGVAGGAMLLILVLIVVLFLRPSPVPKGSVVAVRPAIDPLAYVPPDYNVLFGLHAAELSRKNKLEDLFGLIDKGGQMTGENAEELAEQKQLLRDADRFIQASNSNMPLTSVTIVLTRAPLDQERVKKAFAAEPARDVDGVKVFKARPDKRKPNTPRWLAFPEERLAVFSEQPEKSMDALMTAGKQAPAHPGLELIRQIETSDAWGVVLFDAGTQQKMQQELPKLVKQMAPHLIPMVPAVQQAKGVQMRLDWNAPGALNVQVGLRCANDADARKVKEGVEQFWNGDGKKMLQGLALFLGNPGGPAPGKAALGKKVPAAKPPGPDINKVIQEITQSFNSRQEGSGAWVSVQFSDAVLKEMSNDKK